MKKICLCTAMFVAFCLCISSTATATLFNKVNGGDRVVYDDVSNLIWYPILTDFTGMTLNQQLAAIDSLEYGGLDNWEMASWSQVSALKVSLASMAQVVFPTQFGPNFGDPFPLDDPVGQPRLAQYVDSEEFFTATGLFDPTMVGAPGGQGVFFNGRTDPEKFSMTNIGIGGSGFGGPVVPGFNPADDHWAAINSFNCGDGDDYLTMIFNFDQHYRDPLATFGGPGGAIGAWAVATAPVPEPATMLLFGTGLAGLAGYRRRQQAKKK